MTSSWYQPEDFIETIRLREDGSPEKPADYERDEHGEIKRDDLGRKMLKLDPKTGDPVQQGEPEKMAWPKDAYVHLKNMVTSGDMDDTSFLQMQVGIDAKASDPEAARLQAKLRTYWTPIIYAAVFLRRLECKIGKEKDCSNVFEDRRTCQKDETGAPVSGTGQVLQVPVTGTLEEKLKFARGLDARVTSFINGRVAELLTDPLPGTASAKGTKER